MNFVGSLIALTLSALLLASCQRTRVEGDIPKGSLPEGPGAPAVEDPSEPKDNDSKPEPAPSDGISIPFPITGALLHCRADESTTEVTLDVNCIFQDENANRIRGESIAAAVGFDYTGSLDSSISVDILPASADYEVTYRFRGANFSQIDTASRSLTFLIKFSELVSGSADVMVSALGETTIEPAKPRFIREATTDTNANGVCDGEEFCLYVGAGLMWYRDLGGAKSHGDAFSSCENFSPGFDDYRLPTFAEMEWAFAHGIADFGADDSLALKDGPMWTTDAGTEVGTHKAFNLRSGISNDIPDSESVQSACVRSFP